ncbi:NAD(P)/FAD-dependent oxidoreductase [Lentzea sp. NPDC051213]|uniref:NAD(P)/FAD-dependent oxidoreductase n=1 Tax=Lentzea sp. NPDC051213 TaxID=3364126 RepID=UPI00378CCB93
MATAVVIGAGVAGLLTAKALEDKYSRVIVVERDRLPAEPEYRSGVPQGRHAHGLLLRGAQIMEDFFPGLRDSLIDAGAQLMDAGEARVLTPHGWAAQGETGLPMLSVSRPFLETAIRHRVSAEFVDNTNVLGLRFNGSTVDGVRVRRKDTGADEVIEADLVVLAAGRTAKLPEWLAAAGVEVPEPVSVDSRTGYATRLYALPHNDKIAIGQMISAPVQRRGCSATRIEGGKLLVTLQGADGDHPSNDPEQFMAFARSLDVGLADVLEGLEPLTPIYLYARTASSMRAYEKVSNWPAGLIAVGDAVVTLNPLYGQGMTIAALEAELLSKHTDFSAEGVRAFQAALAKVAAGPFGMSAGADAQWAPDFKPGLMNKLMVRWQVALTQDVDMVRRFLSVMHLQAPPTSLLSPSALWKLRGAKVNA